MKQAKFLVALSVLGAVLALSSAHGQTSQQGLSFSIFGQYQTNEWSTNFAPRQTNDHMAIKSVLISTANVVKAIAIDHDGPAWTNWNGASLLRKTDLNGVEGIYLRKGMNEIPVSSYFSNSFTNNFTFDLTNNFSGATNLNAIFPVLGGHISMSALGTVTNTNTLTSSGLYYVSFMTTNLQFNLVGFGTTTTSNVFGRSGSTRFSGSVNTLEVAGVGTFMLNLGTNLLDATDLVDTNNYFVSGPAHGSFGTAPPVFSTILGP